MFGMKKIIIKDLASDTIYCSKDLILKNIE
jgi:hypothetical protein